MHIPCSTSHTITRRRIARSNLLVNVVSNSPPTKIKGCGLSESATALVEDRRIEGKRVERIIDHSMIGSASAAATEMQRTAIEREIIKTLERLKGRKMTQQEINRSLEQARALGEL